MNSNSAAEDTQDRELMEAVGRQDAQAFARLVERHLGWAMRFVERMVGARQEAEDLVQAGFLRVWQSAARWEPNARFSTWFYRVLHNLCMDHFRANPARTEPLSEEIADGRPPIEDEMQGRERAVLVREALAALPERQRAAIVLCYYEERSQVEAAALLGVSEGALESLLSRGRAALRKHLAPTLH